MTRVKICGITNREDAMAAVEEGADALGFIFFAPSPRYVTPEQAESIILDLPPFVAPVGVFVNETAAVVNAIARQCRLHAVQLHGDESPDFCRHIERNVIKVFRVKDDSWIHAAVPYRTSAVLLDTYAEERYGGTGQTFDWRLIAAISQRVILSGGLTPDNVQDAIRRVRPYAVDASSGVEAEPGVKDHEKIRAFVEAVRKADSGFRIRDSG